MNPNKYSKDFFAFIGLVALLVFIFSFVFFGFTGVRFTLGIIILWVPFYLILDNFELKTEEKVVFSLLMGITVFPSMVYLFGLVMSFMISILVVFIVLVFIAFFIKKFKKK